ncbi:MAG TPA: hypothetical protein VIM81_12040 [Gammaproteobacteria bacterium]
MRTTPLVAALSATAIFAGCGTIEELDGVRVRCENERVKVINVSGGLKVRPERVEVCRGYSVALVFRNSVPPGQAHMRPPETSERETREPAAPPWLSVDNTSPDRMVVSVPPEATPMEYKYTIEIDGLGLLDPRIVVQ